MRAIDLTGQRYGLLTVIEKAESRVNFSRVNTYWKCVCDCGVHSEVSTSNLRMNKVQSCGCVRGLLPKELSQSPEYMAWCNMRYRCDNPANSAYDDYGGRGITYDPVWKDFLVFINDMDRKPPPHPVEGIYTLERLNNDGPYCKANCIWATRQTQNNNSRNTKLLRVAKGKEPNK